MTKFILVHEPTGNDTCKPVLVNVDRIEYCCRGNKGKDTYLKLIGPALVDERDKVKASFFFVKESLEEIQAMINNENAFMGVMEYANLKANSQRK